MKNLLNKLKSLFKKKHKEIKLVEVTYLRMTADVEISMNDKYVINGKFDGDDILTETQFIQTIISYFNRPSQFLQIEDRTTKLSLVINKNEIHKFYIRPKLIETYKVTERVD